MVYKDLRFQYWPVGLGGPPTCRKFVYIAIQTLGPVCSLRIVTVFLPLAFVAKRFVPSLVGPFPGLRVVLQ